MSARDRPRALTETLGAKHFAADRADELLTHSISGAAEETTQNFWRRFGWYCGCHVR
jgi:hypothetical protein